MLPLANFLGLSDVQIVVLISGAALIFAIRRWRRNTVTRNNQSSFNNEKFSTESASRMRDMTVELHALLADLEETSRRLTAQLDNRYVRLEQLLAEADEKIRRLEEFTQDGKAEMPRTAPSIAPPSPARAQPLADAVSEAQRTLSRLRTERGAPPAEQDPAYQPIYSLADRGKSSREIAQELGRQPGEIELILALRRG